MIAMRPINIFKQLLLTLGLTMLLASCGGDSFYGEPTGVDPSTPVASRLIISTDKTAVQSDGSDSANIKVLALDSSNAAVEGVVIDITTTAGVVTAPSIVSDANGEATVSFSAGADPTEQTATITATSGSALPAFVPVDIVGSTVTITPTRDNLVIGGSDTSTVTITAADSAGTGVYNTVVSVYIDGTNSTGAANLSSATGVTNTQGEFVVDLTGTSPGTVRVVATSLNITTYYDFLVESVAGSLLISAPTTGSTAAVNSGQNVTVDVPAGITSITLVTTLGTWSSSGTAVAVHSGLTGPTSVTDTLTSSEVGTASINVEDTNDRTVNDNILLYIVDQTVDANSNISLQASPTTIAPSTSGSQSSSSLEATVYNATGGKIANARVTFSLSNTTGSGEYIYPAVAYTDAFGVVKSTLYAGSQSTDATGLTVTASLDESLTGLPAKSSSANVIVGGTVGSISIGMSTQISSINNNTGYSLPVSVQVSDSGGNPVANTVVTLSLWPEKYALGYWYCEPEPGLWRETILQNEDLDKDTIYDASPIDEDISGDGKLTPAMSSAGTVPQTVTTDENGFATFDITYLKDSAGFVYDAMSAKTTVQGTEAQATRRFWLGAADSDITGCNLGESPFKTAWPVLEAVADITLVSPGGSSSITGTLTAHDSTPMVGELVSATIISEGSFNTVHPTLSASPQTTDGAGKVYFTYTAGDQAGYDWVKLIYSSPAGVVIADYVLIQVQ